MNLFTTKDAKDTKVDICLTFVSLVSFVFLHGLIPISMSRCYEPS